MGRSVAADRLGRIPHTEDLDTADCSTQVLRRLAGVAARKGHHKPAEEAEARHREVHREDHQGEDRGSEDRARLGAGDHARWRP